MTTWTTIHLPTILHFHLGSLATNQHFNMKLLTLSKGWWLFESTSTQGLICHIKEWHRVSWVDSTAKGTRLNGRRKYFSKHCYTAEKEVSTQLSSREPRVSAWDVKTLGLENEEYELSEPQSLNMNLKLLIKLVVSSVSAMLHCSYNNYALTTA